MMISNTRGHIQTLFLFLFAGICASLAGPFIAKTMGFGILGALVSGGCVMVGVIAFYCVLDLLVIRMRTKREPDKCESTFRNNDVNQTKQEQTSDASDAEDASSNHLDKSIRYVVVLAYDAESIPSSDPTFPGVDDDYLYGRCFPVVGESAKELILEYKDKPIRIYKSGTKEVADPGYRIGQDVQTLLPRSARQGKIAEIKWHFKNNTPMFFLEVNGKLLDSRYYANELKSQPG